jgi:hemerythrin-like domain-containing protein
MKRHESLIPLSHDHHDGLLFCWKLRQGLKHGINPSRMVAYCLWFWKEHLSDHFDEEENWLFVAGHPLCSTALQQHAQIRALIDTLPENPENIGALADIVDQHIRLEERQLFPELEQLIPADKLALIGEKLRASHAGTPPACYTDEFWKA